MIKDWRAIQKNFFNEYVEFAQDQRILDFFFTTKKIPTYGYGDISYFIDKINFIHNLKSYEQALLIFNSIIEKFELLEIIDNFKKKLKNNAKICISINKFLLYSNIGDKHAEDNYDQSLKSLIEKQFVKSNIDYYFIKNLKGDSFNFASPTSQFFFNYIK
jgi:hypothetical protein